MRFVASDGLSASFRGIRLNVVVENLQTLVLDDDEDGETPAHVMKDEGLLTEGHDLH